MKIEERLIEKYQYTFVNVVSLTESTIIPEFAEIEETELFEKIKMVTSDIFKEHNIKFSFIDMRISDCGRLRLEDKNNYLYITIRIKGKINGDETSVFKIVITPVGCYSTSGDYILTQDNKMQISRVVRKFLSQKLGQDYVDRNNEYFTNAKNEKIKEIKTKADKEIENAKDCYLENIIL